MIDFISADDLARAAGYRGATSSFRQWCVSLRITPVPGRRGFYDLRLVRRRLDEAQGLTTASDAHQSAPLTLVEQRRARLGKG